MEFRTGRQNRPSILRSGRPGKFLTVENKSARDGLRLGFLSQEIGQHARRDDGFCQKRSIHRFFIKTAQNRQFEFPNSSFLMVLGKKHQILRLILL
jgi:hypothetical protein